MATVTTIFPVAQAPVTRPNKMALRVVDIADPADWLAVRRTGIGSSDAPAIVGALPDAWRRGPLEVYLEKIGEAEARPPSIAMRRGTLLEPLVAQLYAEAQPDRTVSDADGRMFRSREHPHLLASPDRWVEDPERGLGVLELKTSSVWASETWQGGAPPLHVQVQVQHQLLCLGAAWAAVAVLIGDEPIQTWDVPRDDAFLAVYVTHARAFWTAVERREPPPAAAASLDTLKRLYPTVERRTIDLPAEAAAWHRQRVEGEALEARGKAMKNDATAQLLGAMGAAEVGRVPGEDVNYTRQVIKRAGYVVKESEYVQLRATRPRLPRRIA
jgi:putative phage-type endonuclease